jgi:cytochrome c556
MMETSRGVVAIAALAILCLQGEAPDRAAGAQVARGKTRPAATKYLMRGVVQAGCKGIGELLKDPGPSDDKAWDTLACHASCLSELSFSLMQDGRCPDGVWAAAAKSLGEGSGGVLAAAEKKDAAAARTAFKSVTDACKACHDAHRKSK